ncbi:MAG: hypothetical protein ACRDH2_12620, partial [Anaerolineales bacterium]
MRPLLHRPSFVVLAFSLVVLGVSFYPRRAALHQWAFNLTGEEEPLAQVRGLGQLATDLIRPRLNLQPEVPIQHNGVNPYGINTFLQQEVEPEKRERQVQLIAEAGFHWLRQEFPWYDIEISGRGNFDDCRHGVCISAWDKYDQIVTLAEEYGLEIIARLSSPPDWSRADGSGRSPRGAFAPPDNFSDFADYAAAVAERYRGRVRYFQVWNEPNGNAEWGHQPVDPEAYTRLLCETYPRLKAVDPDIVVLAAALTPTNELGAANEAGSTNLNDFIFLQRMYDAGAKVCFDLMSVQGYGLFSGPTDGRTRPIVVNYGRNQFIRDIMAANGDAHKAIWISEMNWNATPSDSGIAPAFGQVTDEQQARYAPLAYLRAQAEWPWVGVNTFWYFKDADDHERGQAKYYFRMADPDFTLRPVYASLKDYLHRTPVMRPGWFQEDHWAVRWDEGWSLAEGERFEFGRARRTSTSGAAARFLFNGTDLLLVVMQSPEAGQIAVRVDQGQLQTFDLHAEELQTGIKLAVASGLRDGDHSVEIFSEAGSNAI